MSSALDLHSSFAMDMREQVTGGSPDPSSRQFYIAAMQTLDRATIPYLVGGGYAMTQYTGIARHTKDLDLFVRPDDSKRALAALAAAGYRTEYFYPFWIAKALCGDAFVDILYNSGNGICIVDDEWFEHSQPAEILGQRVKLVPPEEQIWSKAFVMDRDRFDGADVAHLILARGHQMDWPRMLRRFNGHERVLFAHLVLFGYIYPADRDQAPMWVMNQLWKSLKNEEQTIDPICNGTNLAQYSYGQAIRKWGYTDGRAQPHGALTPQELAQLPQG